MTHPAKPALRALRYPFDDATYHPPVTQAFGNVAPFEPAVYSYGDGCYGWTWEPGCTQANTHTGIDWGLDANTPLLAVAAGTVRACTPPAESFGFGFLTILDHGDRLLSFYAHQSRFGCTPGQTVRAGEAMGFVGNTGNSSGAHLHFALGMDDGNQYFCFFSPLPYLTYQPAPAGYPTAGKYRVLVDMFLRTEPDLKAPHGRLVKKGEVLTAYKGWTTHFRAVEPLGHWAWAPNLSSA